MNEIAWLEYELAYYDSVVHRFNHYTTRTPPLKTDVYNKQYKQNIVIFLTSVDFVFHVGEVFWYNHWPSTCLSLQQQLLSCWLHYWLPTDHSWPKRVTTLVQIQDVFQFMLISWVKAWIHLVSLQLWVKS